MSAALPPELRVALGRIDTCSLANAIEGFDVRLRNEGFTDGRIRCLFPRLAPLVGHAATVRIRCSGPPVEGRPAPEHTEWWDHILRQPAPRVVVIEDVDRTPGAGAFIGGIHGAILRALDCVGVVTNGAVRDLPAAEAAGFHLFAGGVAVSHSYAHLVEVGGEVEVGGLHIRPGDWLHGDQHGILSVPPAIAPELPGAVRRLAEHEQRILALCASGTASLNELRAAVAAVRPDPRPPGRS